MILSRLSFGFTRPLPCDAGGRAFEPVAPASIHNQKVEDAVLVSKNDLEMPIGFLLLLFVPATNTW